MPIKAKAVVFAEPREVEVWELDMPDPGPEDIVVRMIYSGISVGTEGWILRGERPEDSKFPCVPGYQQTGEVVEIGPEVKGIAVGDIVNLWSSRLPDAVNHGWGGHVEYSVQDYRSAVRVPQGLSLPVAALAKLFAVGYRGVLQTGVESGDLVAVIGQGIIGQGYAQLARLSGARVIGAEVLPMRRALAAKHSCDAVVEATGEPLRKAVFAEKPGGADVVAETAGKTELMDHAVEVVKTFGKLVWQGWYPGRVSFQFHPAHTKRVTMVFPCSLEGEAEVLRLLAEGKLVLEPLITHILPAEDAPRAWDMLLNRADEALGVVLRWG